MSGSRTIFLAFCIIFSFYLLACSQNSQSNQNEFSSWINQNGKVKILSTTAMVNDLVKQVGGDHVDTLVLVKGELDPHSYQLVKGDDEKLIFADLIFYNGLGLEHGPSLQKYLYGNEKAIPIGERVQNQYPNLILHYNGQLDPHIWMDISLWVKTVPFVVSALSQKDPVHAETFEKNGKRLIQEMLEVDNQVRDELNKIPEEKRYLVTSHDAFNYFAKAYLASNEERIQNNWQKRFAAPEGLAPESQLSSVDIQLIIDHLSRYNIHVLFSESNVSKDSIKKIVSAGKEKGLNLAIAKCHLYGDAMGPLNSDGDTYLKMIQHNAKTIAKHLMTKPSEMPQ